MDRRGRHHGPARRPERPRPAMNWPTYQHMTEPDQSPISTLLPLETIQSAHDLLEAVLDGAYPDPTRGNAEDVAFMTVTMDTLCWVLSHFETPHCARNLFCLDACLHAHR